MASPAPPSPLGEDAWIDYIEQRRRTAFSLEQRKQIVQLYEKAVVAEPGSIRVWISFCEYFWSLYAETINRTGPVASWPVDDHVAAAREFSLDNALRLWGEGNRATEYRISDSHELWDRWIALERELLDSTGTSEGIRRITQLYRNRLTVPHATWDETSSAFSSFLSVYNKDGWEETMREVTQLSRTVKYLYEQRDRMEMALSAAVRSGDEQAQREAMTDYLDWEVANVDDETTDVVTAVRLALGLFSRALSGIFLANDLAWTDLIVFVSRLYRGLGEPPNRNEELAQVLPNRLDIMQCAVQHCPWSGPLWSRYIICGEQASLSFSDMERIKHAATNSAIDRDGMTAVVEMYAAWCGYLHRSAMEPNASDETVDIADSGLVAALEAVQVWGERRFGSSYQGDPEFRLERLVIQHLSDKHGAISEARGHWEKLAAKDLHRNNYSFWLSFFSWEMNVFMSQRYNGRSPTPAPPSRMRVPREATDVLRRAVQNSHINWPQRIIDVYIMHCNDIETSDVLRNAFDDVHKLRKTLMRQEKDAAAAAHSQAAQAEPASDWHADGAETSPSGVKRKRDEGVAEDSVESASKRPRKADPADDEEEKQQALKRDRENTSAYVTNLPADVTSTKVRQYFRDYGHVTNIQLKTEKDGRSAVALVEFKTVQDLRSALIRDGKYFGERTVSVTAATGVTLFVTNFPPSADDAYIRDLFRDCGEIFATRWPSLKFNTHRRFCYVAFRTAEAAAQAVRMDGHVVEGWYKLSVNYSDPGAKKRREGATEEGREVHVKHLGADVDEASLKDIFAKYGRVERVRLLRNMAGRSRGSAFVVFETKDEALHAVAELDKVKMGNQLLSVDISVPGQYKPSARETSVNPSVAGSDKPGDEEDEKQEDHHSNNNNNNGSDKDAPRDRTFALLGIPDTVNIARVRALVEPHGRITKLVLRADHGGAILEFADAATAGKAQLALEGAQLDQHPLRTGTVAELFKEKAERRVDRVDLPTARTKPAAAPKDGKTTASAAAAAALVPTRVKRPVLGGKGTKRGLGFSGSISTPATKNKTETTTNGDAGAKAGQSLATVKKTNSEFRALFLGGNAKGTGGGTKEGTKEETKVAGVHSRDANSEMEIDTPVVNGH